MEPVPPNVRAVFDRLLDLASPDEQDAYLEAACAGAPQLRQEVEALLRAHRDAGSFLQAAPPGLTAPPPAREAPGARIGPYRLLEAIGEGGMGTVWMAEQTQPVQRRVALKVIKAGMDSHQVLARFEAERQALALMDHPNIARVFDGGATEQGRPYFVMELVQGLPLTSFCDLRRLTVPERLGLFVSVCQAVQHAHSKGVIHRDLKPSNVLVALYDGKPVPKVIDFGVAKATREPLTEKTLVTGLGSVVGTLEYMSPEQAELDQLDIDTRSDIYSLGVLLYELLSGSPPFSRQELEQTGLLEMLRVIREQEPARPSIRLSTADNLPALAASRGTEPRRLAALVRGELDWIVMKALEKGRTRRYDTADGLARDVERYLADEPVQACPPSAVYRLQKFARRNKRALATAAVMVLAVLLAAATFGWAVRDRAAQQQEAAREQEARRARLAGDMQLALDRAELFHEQGKRAEALAAFERADQLAAEAAPDPDLHQRLAAVRETLDAEARDQAFVAHFEHIRLVDQSKVDEEKNRFALEEAYPRLKQLLRDYGIEIGPLAPAEAVRRIRSRPEVIRGQLLVALDECLRMGQWWKDAAACDWLTAVLREADQDSWRAAVRKTYAARDWRSLMDLAREADVAEQPPHFLILLVRMLRDAEPGPWSARLALCQRIQRAYPGDFWANADLASELVQSGQPSEAIGYYNAALALRPNNPGVLLRRAAALLKAEQVDAAVADLQQALAVAPRYKAAHLSLVSALHKRGDREGTIAASRRAIDLAPVDPLVHYQLGLALEARGDREGAIAAYRAAIARNSEYAAPHFKLAALHKARGDWQSAIAAREEALRCSPASVSALTNLAWDLAACPEAKLRQPQRALELARKAVGLDQKSSGAWQVLGWAEYRNGNWKASIEALEKSMALQKEPKGGDAFQWFFLAMAHERLGHKAEARKWFDQAVDWLDAHNPENAEALGFQAEAEQVLGVSVQGRAKPFVVLGQDDKPAKSFTTLSGAIAVAPDRSTVEIRGNGPFDYRTIKMGNKSLVIRAGVGFRPRLRHIPEPRRNEDVGSPLLSTGGSLVLEGLQLQGESSKGAPGGELLVTCWGGGALHVANCRFQLADKRWNCIWTNSSVTCKNCEFVFTNGGTALNGEGTTRTHVVIDNCVQAGGGLCTRRHRRADTPKESVVLTHNTLVCRSSVNLHATSGRWNKGETPGPCDLECAENIFVTRDPLLVFTRSTSKHAPSPPPPQTARELLGLMRWAGERNLYSVSQKYLTWENGIVDPPTPGPRSLKEWGQFWQSAETGSLEGTPRFQGGDLMARTRLVPHEISAQDFRLLPGSPGKGAGKDGRDLGADVDRVGPGKAYENWKKTPEYQEWLKRTGQVK